ncbi:hypothetical protein LAZ67_13000853, partial [Cordylochernes scorpioides]
MAVTSRTVEKPNQSITHYPVSARTIRRGLQQSGLSERCPLLCLPLTQNHRRLHRQCCDKKGCGRQNGMKLSLLTNHDSLCNTTIVGFESGHRGERMLNSCVMHRHTGPVPGIMVWGGIGYHSRTPLISIAGTLNSQRYVSEVLEPVVLPYLQGLLTVIFQQDNARPHVARIVQRFLTNEQKLCRLATCEDMLEMTRTDPEWKDKIITGYETWVYGYDPETKHQSPEWRCQAVLKGSEPWIETLKLDNIAIKMKLDTGADVIAIPLHIFKKKCKHRELRPANRTLREFFGQILKCAGMFTGKLKYGDVDIEEPIYVTYQMRETLLSGNACVKLKLLVRLNSLKAATFSSVNVKREFPKHFVGIGKVGEPYKIKLKMDAQPFAIHTPRRVPIPLMEKLKTRLSELQNMDIVQPVQEATEWCAPTVIASKTNGDIRLCVDLSKLNIGIERETHPMPVVEHMLGQLGEAKFFSKLDANSGFHQIPLIE